LGQQPFQSEFMKKTILLHCLALFSLLSVAQEQPKRGVNTVMIENQQTKEENFVSVGSSFVDLGFSIGKKDREFGLITSDTFITKGDDGFKYEQVIEATIKDNFVILRSKYRPVSSIRTFGWEKENEPFKEVVYNKRSFGIAVFSNMTKVANKLKGTISYQ